MKKEIFIKQLFLLVIIILPLINNAQQIVAFQNINLITMTSEKVIASQTVITKGDRIVQIGNTADIKIPDGAKVIDGTGKFLMPGLADMHTHPSEFYDLVHPLNLFLANGVTTIRTLPSDDGAIFILRWRDEINKGNRIGPKIFSSGITHNDNFPKKNYEFQLSEEKRLGFDIVKLYSGLDKNSYAILMAIAKENKMYTVGHIPFSVGLDGILSSGMNEIAHLEEVVFNELFEVDRNKKVNPFFDLYVDFILHVFQKYKTVDNFDMNALIAETDSTFDKIVKKLQKSNTLVNTTLAVDDIIIKKILKSKDFMANEDWVYLSENYKNTYKAGKEKHQQQFKIVEDFITQDINLKTKLKNAENYALVKFALDSVLCSKMNKAGCTLIFGTDAGVGMGIVCGKSIHNEFAMLVKCGLTPYQALLTSTVNASKAVQAMNGSDDFGTIEINKRADLILLDKNPLENIENMKAIAGTMAAGNWLDKKTLDEMVKIDPKNIPISGQRELMKISSKKGIKAAIEQYWIAKNTKGNENRINVDENQINALGYDYIKDNELKSALEIFKLNTIEYPLSWNVWDSYGEILAKNGDIIGAKENYQKAIMLNPNSQISKKALEDLNYINMKWTGSSEQKIMGLMTIWGEAKYAFPWFDKLSDLNWDEKVQEFIPRVMETKDIESYYKVLAEFTALLKDGHTYVTAPWGFINKDDDAPALEVQIVEDKFIIASIGNSDEIKKQNIVPGMEIVDVEKNILVYTYFKEKVLRYYSADSKQGQNVWSILLFMGKRGTNVTFKVKEMNGNIREVKLTRNGLSSSTPFIPRYYKWSQIDKKIETKKLDDGILYIKIPNFNSENKIDKQFLNLLENNELSSAKGLIIDLRFNGGGSDIVANNITACLIDKEISATLKKYPQYVAAYRAWEKTAEILQLNSKIYPRNDKIFTGPLVILTGNGSASTSEDMAIELQFSKRALLVGEKTAGSAGGSVSFKLPGGGSFSCSTFKSYYPNGKEYVHIGIQPDVEVNYTQKDIIEGKDPILLKGIEVIKNWQTYSIENK